jgi:Ni/Co efflux regulator RcnB
MRSNVKTLVSAIAALSMGISGLACAQNRDDRHGPDHGRAPMAHHDMHDRDGPGAGPDHNFRRGGRLPVEYRNRQYVVDDWRGHHLRQPPRGYHWVQTGGDYVLAAIATGVIADILLNH